jgi:hypothetical protein
MSQLDRHVTTVRNKLALGRFIAALAWVSLGFASLAWLLILIDRLFQFTLPRKDLWFWSGVGFTFAAATAYAVYRRPSAKAAAVAIDQKLGLKEKISTALYVRPDSDDPFAAAAVRDAEMTAEKVVIDHRRFFPLRFPRQALATVAVAGLALWTSTLSPLDLFGREEQRKRELQERVKIDEAQRSVDRAIATVEAIPQALANEEAIRLARNELMTLRAQVTKDPEQARRSAARALQDVNEAIRQRINSSQEYAQAKNQERMLKQLPPPQGGEGPVSDAHHAMVKGEFGEAVAKLDETLEKFDRMDEQAKEKATEQMQHLAQSLQQMAGDPKVQEQIEKQLQQMGMDQQQARQAQQLMQQAAQGDKPAQQQLQQMARQMMEQMNNGQGPNPQQQQQIQQMMQQMQAQANNQQTAQQMAEAAQQLARAMQQQQQQQQQQQGQQQAQQQQGQQQMNQGMQAMRQQLQQMQAVAQDAQQMQAAQGQAQAAQADAQAGLNGGQPGGQNANGGQWAQGNNMGNQQEGEWNGMAGPAGANPGGIGAGDRNFKSPAPFTVKPEVSQSQDNESGQLLASTFVKDSKPIRGESTVTLKDVAAAAQADQTDEVDQERISPQAQKVVREYFGAMERAAAATSTPQNQPAPRN